jgi:hypothetical protein
MEDRRLWACERDSGFMAQVFSVASLTAVAEDDEGEEESDGSASCCCPNAYSGCGFRREVMRAFVVLTEGRRSCRRGYAYGWSCG